jgi:hypothetical protein
MSVITQTPVNINSTGWTPIVIESNICGQVRFCETDQAATTDYLLAAPNSTSGPKTIPAGKEYALAGYFQRGDIVCYLKAATGSADFDVLEDGLMPPGAPIR